MGLAKRIIPVILHKAGQLVKGQNFVNDRVVGHALQAARIHAARGVDELLVLDITATAENREPNYALTKALAESNFSPLTVGGGVKTEDHVRKLLRSGADKVCIGKAAINNYKLIHRLASKFGSQCITVSIDYSKDELTHDLAIFLAKQYEAEGAGEILLQSVDNDGTMKGYDLQLIIEVTKHLSIPVIASGGCGSYRDMYLALRSGADAVAAGSMFLFENCTPKGAAEYLDSKGIEVRV